MKLGLKKAAIAGIAGEILYFISMWLFLITQTGVALTFWELMTVAGAVIMLIVLIVIAEDRKIQQIHHKLMMIALSGTVFLTSIAHFTSIGVVRKLESQGISVPDYFKIGTSPSIEMTVDYVAWGFFMGLAFIALFLGIKDKAMKIISVACGVLCLCGFVGSFISDHLWYIAPLGYGIGFLVMCIYVFRSAKAH
ncbi:MAG: hypothetical protein J6Y71_05590 [Ruminococcus sp.]|nr:hypothetical protein [Ruminococcus sp.]